MFTLETLIKTTESYTWSDWDKLNI